MIYPIPPTNKEELLLDAGKMTMIPDPAAFPGLQLPKNDPATPTIDEASNTFVFTLSPNPNAGSFACTVSGDGALNVCSVDGKQVGSWELHEGSNTVALPAGLSSGMYFATYKPANGATNRTLRFVYQP